MALVAVLALGGCSSGSGDDAASPSATGTETSGLVLTGGVSEFLPALAVDGAGDVWVDGPLELTRVDPETGESSTWDVAEDLAFGEFQEIAPSQEPGVWLLSMSRVRRFDGEGFAVDLEVPEELNAHAGFGVADLVEMGEDLWITNDADVTARWSGGSWTVLPEGRGGPFAVVDGELWAGDRSYPGPVYDLFRYTDGDWVRPGADGTYPTGDLMGIVPDGEGGTWVLAASLLYHFDGTAWSTHKVPSELGLTLGQDVVAVGPDSSVWVAGMRGVGRYQPDGTWQTFDAADGLPPMPAGEGLQQSVAVAGDDVIVATRSGVYRLSGSRFELLVASELAGPTDVYELVAVGRDEVWASSWSMAGFGWWRYADGAWTQVGPQGEAGDRGVLAADGSVWATTSDGLVRFVDEEWTLMSDTIDGHQLAAAPDGTVWAVESGRVVGFTADGAARTELPDPPGRELAAGEDGTVWVSNGPYMPSELSRWDDGWQKVDLPPTWSGIASLVVDADGALWATTQIPVADEGLDFELGRYADGSWTTFEVEEVSDIAASPDGVVCIVPNVTCFDATGMVSERLPGVSASSISIAPDGSTWVLGEQVIRLADGNPLE